MLKVWWLALLAFTGSPIRLSVVPQVVYVAKPIQIEIHATYEPSDRWMRLEWSPATVGDSEWPVDEKSRSTWRLTRRVYEAGDYRVRAVIGGRTVRAQVAQNITVVE